MTKLIIKKTQFIYLLIEENIALKNEIENPETFFQKKIHIKVYKNIFEIPLIPLKNTFFSKV